MDVWTHPAIMDTAAFELFWIYFPVHFIVFVDSVYANKPKYTIQDSF
jgi:hypothetical protein